MRDEVQMKRTEIDGWMEEEERRQRRDQKTREDGERE